MTQSRDPDRLIHAYLMEGAEHLQDRVYDTVRADIEHKRQRDRFGPWRLPIMNKVALGLAAAGAVAVAIVVGTRLLPSAIDGAGSSPPVESTPAPSVSATSTGGLPLGPLEMNNAGAAVTITIPAAGWFGDPPYGILIKDQNADPPNGAALFGPFVGDLFVYGDPCHWSTTIPSSPATTVDQVVTALQAQPLRDASTPVDLEVDGFAGKSITVHVPDALALAGCDQGKFASWAGGGEPVSDGPARYHQGPGQIDELWILDVNGQLIVMDAFYGKETPAANLAELHAILQSMTFEE